MSFRKINSLIKMQDSELNRFTKSIKQKENDILNYISKNKNKKFKIKIFGKGKKKKIFIMRGSFEKYLITKLTI